MSTEIGSIIFNLVGSNANIITNLIGYSSSSDSHNKCGEGSGLDGKANLAVVGTEIVGASSSLIGELDNTHIGDKFWHISNIASRANAAFSVGSIVIKVAQSDKPWHQTLSSGDFLTISGAALGFAATLAGAPVLLGTAAAAVSIAGTAWTLNDLVQKICLAMAKPIKPIP